LTGGIEKVQAYQGYNSITTGASNGTIRFAGSGNTINAGGGHNSLYDSGDTNTIVMPGAGQGRDDIYGHVLQNGDKFNFTAALKATSWDGLTSDIGSFLHVKMSGHNVLISISNQANGAQSLVADLHSVGQVNLAGMLQRSIF